MALTHDYLNYLDNMVDIAPANSQEELLAAQEIATLMRTHGVETSIEEFDAPSWGRLPYQILYILLFIGVFSAGLGGSIGVVGTLLSLVAAAVIFLDYRGIDLFEKFGPNARSQNVVAVHRATGPLVTKGVRPIVIIAHYDTPKESFLRSTALANYLPLINRISPWCALAAGIVALIERMGFIPGAVLRFFWIIGLVAALPLLLLGVGVLAERFSSCTEGANNNKSGVAAMLGVLEDVHPTGKVPEPVRLREREVFELEEPANEGFDIPRGDKKLDAEAVEVDDDELEFDENSAFTSSTEEVIGEESANEQTEARPFYAPIFDFFNSFRKQDVDDGAFADDGEYADTPEELLSLDDEFEVKTSDAKVVPIEPIELEVSVGEVTPDDEGHKPEENADTKLKAEPAAVAAAVAGTVRHGKDVIEKLGILPRSCEIEYVEPPVSVEKVPIGAEPPAPEAEAKKSFWARFLEGLGFEPKDEELEDETSSEESTEEGSGEKKNLFARLFGFGEFSGSDEEEPIEYDEEEFIPLPEEGVHAPSVEVMNTEDIAAPVVAPIFESNETAVAQDSIDEVVTIASVDPDKDEDVTAPEHVQTETNKGGFWSFIKGALDVIAPVEDGSVDADLDNKGELEEDVKASVEEPDEKPEDDTASLLPEIHTSNEGNQEYEADATIMAPLESFTEGADLKTSLPSIGDTAESKTGDQNDASGYSVTREQLLQDGRFALDVDESPDDSGIGEKDNTGLDNTADVFDPAEEEPQAQRERPQKPEDTDWGESSYEPAGVDVARRAALFDLPDPSEKEQDPFISDDSSGYQDVAPAAESTTENDTTQSGSFVEWLGVDENFDAKTSGRKIGSWKNFMDEEDDSWKGGATTREGLRGDGGTTSEGDELHNYFSEVRMAAEPSDEDEALEEEQASSNDVNETHDKTDEETAVEEGSTFNDGVENNVETKEPVEEVAVEEAAPVEAELEHDERLGASEEELREAVLSLNDDALQCHDIWFVALGASDRAHAGMQAFLAEHRSEVRGCFLINLDSIGAGNLSILSNEGLGNTRRADRRMTRIIKQIAKDLHAELLELPYDWTTTDATPAMRKFMRGLTLMGTDESGMAALSHTPDDIIENLEPSQVALVNDIVTELIRRA